MYFLTRDRSAVLLGFALICYLIVYEAGKVDGDAVVWSDANVTQGTSRDGGLLWVSVV